MLDFYGWADHRMNFSAKFIPFRKYSQTTLSNFVIRLPYRHQPFTFTIRSIECFMPSVLKFSGDKARFMSNIQSYVTTENGLTRKKKFNNKINEISQKKWSQLKNSFVLACVILRGESLLKLRTTRWETDFFQLRCYSDSQISTSNFNFIGLRPRSS